MKKYLNYVEIIFGIMLTAMAFSMIILPLSFASGGITGLSVILSRYIPLPLSLIVLLLNSILFLLGGLFVGKEFILKTALSTLLFPLFLDIFSKIPLPATHHYLSMSLLAGLLMGMGGGLIIKCGGSSGGFDVIGVILHKKYHTPVSLPLYIGDMSVILLQGNEFSRLLYGLITIALCSLIIPLVNFNGSQKSLQKQTSPHHSYT